MALSVRGSMTFERRLGEITGGQVAASEAAAYNQSLMDALKRVGQVAPRSTKEVGKLQQRLVTAGYRGKEAIVIFFGIRLACAVAFFLLLSTPILVKPNLLYALAGCGLGYILPGILLARMAK